MDMTITYYTTDTKGYTIEKKINVADGDNVFSLIQSIRAKRGIIGAPTIHAGK